MKAVRLDAAVTVVGAAGAWLNAATAEAKAVSDESAVRTVGAIATSASTEEVTKDPEEDTVTTERLRRTTAEEVIRDDAEVVDRIVWLLRTIELEDTREDAQTVVTGLRLRSTTAFEAASENVAVTYGWKMNATGTTVTVSDEDEAVV